MKALARMTANLSRSGTARDEAAFASTPSVSPLAGADAPSVGLPILTRHSRAAVIGVTSRADAPTAPALTGALA